MTPEEIRTIRVMELGFTQKELAKALGLTGPRAERTIEDWEAGRRTPPPYLKLALERLVGSRLDPPCDSSRDGRDCQRYLGHDGEHVAYGPTTLKWP